MIKEHDIFAAAADQGKSAAFVAVANGIKPKPNMWREISKDFESAIELYSDVDLLSIKGIKGTFIDQYASAVANSIQFPKSTAMMHLMGCISTACSHRFSVKLYNNDLHVGLYVIGAQPPAAGKSAVNDAFQKKISIAYEQLNTTNRKEVAKINFRIAKIKNELKAEGTNINLNHADSLMRDIEREEERLLQYPIYRYNVTDATPEALGDVAARAGGNFTLVSDEATVINTALGLSYGAEGRVTNNEAILKGWDGGIVATARIGRDTPQFFAKGAVSVLAQSETILSILKSGERGNGLTERFMFINERPNIGNRVYVDENGESLYQGIPSELSVKYAKMVHSMVIGDPVVLTMKKSAQNMVAMQKQLIEPKLQDSGEFGGNLLRGVMGKMDKQVYKLASIIHLSKEWCEGGTQKKEIQDDTVAAAITLFMKLSETFIGAAQSEGYAGHEAEVKKVIDRLSKDGRATGVVKFTSLYKSLRNVLPFKGSNGFSEKLKDKILPDLEKHNYIVFDGKDIYINPEIL